MLKISMHVVLSILVLAGNANAHTGACGEGQARKVSALHKTIKSAQDSLELRLSEIMALAERIEEDIEVMSTSLGVLESETFSLKDYREALEAEASKRRACFEEENSGSIYWPSHKNANEEGCVAHSKLWTSN